MHLHNPALERLLARNPSDQAMNTSLRMNPTRPEQSAAVTSRKTSMKVWCFSMRSAPAASIGVLPVAGAGRKNRKPIGSITTERARNPILQRKGTAKADPAAAPRRKDE